MSQPIYPYGTEAMAHKTKNAGSLPGFYPIFRYTVPYPVIHVPALSFPVPNFKCHT